MKPASEPSAPTLIPTRFREPIWRDLSYPIGSTQLSAELAGVPQFSMLSVAFSGVPYQWRDKGYLHQLAHQPRPVLEALYSNKRVGFRTSNDDVARGAFGEKWDLTVYAVPSSLKATIRAALGAEGLATVRDWLAKPRSETWRGDRRHQLEILYDFDARVMSCQENR